MDDGSTDDTDALMAEYMAKDARFQYHHRPKDRLPGGNAARNYGFEISKGDYIQWFDSDDLMHAKYISLRMCNIEEKYDLLIVNGQRLNFNKEKVRNNSFKNKNNLYTDFILKNIEILTPSIMFKRELLLDFDLFKEDMLRSQEVEFFSRFLFEKQNLNCLLIEKIGYFYTSNPDSKSVKDKIYISNLKKDHLSVHQENWIRAKKTANHKVQGYCSKKIIELLFSSISNSDKSLYLNIYSFAYCNLIWFKNFKFNLILWFFKKLPIIRYRAKKNLIKILSK